MKRWVQEKQQRDKNASTQARKHRHKSVGDTESNSKNKRQQTIKVSNIFYDDKTDVGLEIVKYKL